MEDMFPLTLLSLWTKFRVCPIGFMFDIVFLISLIVHIYVSAFCTLAHLIFTTILIRLTPLLFLFYK